MSDHTRHEDYATDAQPPCSEPGDSPTTRRLGQCRIDPDLCYENDPEAQRFVAEHPNGATLEEIAELFGTTRERIRQVEEAALCKLKLAIHRLDPRNELRSLAEDMREWDKGEARG